MINNIQIEDFQSHICTHLTLHPCFNIICGTSGSGKSAFLRALNALFYNNMQGTSFVRIDPKEKPDRYLVAATVQGTGKLVSKVRGTSVNKYTIVDGAEVSGTRVFGASISNPQGTSSFDNVKTTVPDQVRDTLKIYPVKIDSTKEINIQYCGQFDSPFMLMEPDSAKMKFLNTISGTAAVDLAIKEANLQYQHAKKDYEAAELDINKLKLASKDLDDKISVLETANTYLAGRVKELKDLEKEGDKLKAIKAVSDSLVSKFRQVRAMEDLYKHVKFTEITEKVSKLEKFFGLAADYAEILSKYKSVNQALKRYEEAHIDELSKKVDLLMKYQELQDKYTGLRERVVALNTSLTPLTRATKKNVTKGIETLQVYVQLKTGYDKLLALVLDNRGKLDTVKKSLDKSIADYVQLLSEFKVCPVCKGTITDDVLEHIKNEL